MKRKDLIGKTLRVIVWGFHEYDGSTHYCIAKSFNILEESENFYFKNGNIHYILDMPTRFATVYPFKMKSRLYVFNLDGVCISHQPKKWLNKPGAFCRYGGDGRKGLPYAELTIS